MGKIVPEVITPCQGETGVKQYHCTCLRSRLFGLKADGFLQVTNKRTIFRASGKSITGNSIIQSEVPIEDVSGISMYKGTYFSIKHLVLGILAVILAIIVSFIILGAGAIGGEGFGKALPWICFLASIYGTFTVSREKIWNPIIASVGMASVMMILGTSFINSFSMSFGGTASGSTVFFGLLVLAMTV